MRNFVACALLIGPLWLAVPVVQAAPLVTVAQEELDPVSKKDQQRQAAADEENPWVAYLMAPMTLPWFWDSCLDGWAPWGRSGFIKYLTSACTVGLGGFMVSIFPVAIVLTLVGLALAVVGFGFAVYAFFTGMLKDGCCSPPTVNAGSRACGGLFDIWNMAMCVSYVMCTPWFGFKLIQRGWLAATDPIEDISESPSDAPLPSENRAPAPERLEPEVVPQRYAPEAGSLSF